MKKLIVIIAALLCFSVSARAESITEKTGINSLVGASPADRDFVTEAAIGDMFETTSSELAAIRGDQRARDFAATMNEDHQMSSSELSLTIKPHIDQTPLPSKLDTAHQLQLDTLATLQADAFNKQYFKDQIKAHEDAVALFERYISGGKDAALLAFAQKTLPTLKEHLNMLRKFSE